MVVQQPIYTDVWLKDNVPLAEQWNAPNTVVVSKTLSKPVTSSKAVSPSNTVSPAKNNLMKVLSLFSLNIPADCRPLKLIQSLLSQNINFATLNITLMVKRILASQGKDSVIPTHRPPSLLQTQVTH